MRRNVSGYGRVDVPSRNDGKFVKVRERGIGVMEWWSNGLNEQDR
ncbi:MAG: hypothetical protein WB586_13210 [Chthoniobacterales bacterium]